MLGAIKKSQFDRGITVTKKRANRVAAYRRNVVKQ